MYLNVDIKVIAIVKLDFKKNAKIVEEKIKEQYNSIVNGEGDLPVPISRLKCPIDGCNCKDPCILGSWLFDKYNKGIENV